VNDIRDTVLRSLSAVGAINEARFYAELFAAQDPERFALIALDKRCLEEPLLEALISNLRILSDLGLVPVLLAGNGQAEGFKSELENVSVEACVIRFENDDAEGRIRTSARTGIVPIVEISTRLSDGLEPIVSSIKPAKVIFLQPSGGITINGNRLPVLNISRLNSDIKPEDLTQGQARFIDMASDLASDSNNVSVYVMASPLNLLAELFTTKGSGTMLRRAANVRSFGSYEKVDIKPIQASVEESFGKNLNGNFFKKPIKQGFIESNYRGGAILTTLAGLPYLSKFWVSREARGEGIARDIWDAMCAETSAFFWRSRMENPFNDWYMRVCEGMQISGEWRVFWKGLKAPEIPGAIIAAASAPDDFNSKRHSGV